VPEFEELAIEIFYPLLKSSIRVTVILLAAMVISRIIQRWVPRLRTRIVAAMRRHADSPDVELEKRAATLGGIFRKTFSVIVWAVALIMILREGGFDIGPILAGAGVVGLAVGFGAQNLVRDVISGMFMLVENQVRVHDVAIINGTGGLVEEINLRTTVLRSQDGVVHVFPNGTITSLSNMTREFSYYVFDLGVAYKEDTDRVVRVVKELADEMMEEDEFRPFILEPLEVLGVDRFADSAVIIKMRIKTMPIRQWMVGREMNRRIKKRFDELGIEIPFPHHTLYFGEASRPFDIRTTDGDRERMKALIREVIDERGRTSPSDEARSG
jgi:moderate conductance mechanosensitive channel